MTGAAWSRTSTGPDKDGIPFGINMVADDPGDFGKILHIDVMIHNQQYFGKHHLAQAPQSVHHLPCMPRILFLIEIIARL